MAGLGDGADGTLTTVVIDATPLTYWRRGLPRAHALVMLHGLGSDHTGLLDLAAGLDGIQLIAPDLPGFGHSAPVPAGHTLLQYATVLDGLRRHLGLTRFALLGHSFGADIALVYAGTYPAAVSDLCLLNPVLGTAGMAARLGELYCQVGAALPRPLARAWLASRAAVYLQDRASLTTHDPMTRRRILQRDCITARQADPRAIVESVRSIRETRFDRYAQSVRARTLLVTGSRDGLAAPPSLTGLPWQWPYPELKVVPGAGHLLPVEQPDHAAAIVGQFLDASSKVRRRGDPRRQDAYPVPSSSDTGTA